MDYIAALTPPFVMAVAFTALVVTIVKSQGGSKAAKEDAAVDAALSASRISEGTAEKSEHSQASASKSDDRSA